MIIKSKYTVIYDIDGDVLLYNTRNGVQILIEGTNNELMSDVKVLKTGENCDTIKNPTLKQAFCIESDVNELSCIMANYYKQMFDPTDLAFIIMPNNICNFQCIYCYQEHDARLMSEETIENFIKAVKHYHQNHGLKHFYAEWFGGEPFMTFDIIKRVTNELVSYFDANNVSYHFGATTNGSLFTSERIRYLFENKFDYFQITLDGNSVTHNHNRPYVNGNGSWKQICDNLLLLHQNQDAKFNVAIRVNYNNDTFEGVSELFDFIKTQLDERFSIFFHTIGKWGGKYDECFNVVDPALEPYTTLMLMDQAVEYGIQPKTNYDFYNPFRKMCYASLPYHFTLGSDGKLRKCNEEDEKIDKFNIVGTIENGKIEIDLNKWSRYVLPGGSTFIPEKCKECIYWPICFGQNCPKSRILNGFNSCPHDLSIMSEVIINKYKYKKHIEKMTI